MPNSHVHNHVHYHNGGRNRILSAIREMESKIMSKLDDLGAAVDQEISLVNQDLAKQVTDAATSAATIADLQTKLAAALAQLGAVDPAVQTILDKTNAEVATLQATLTPATPAATSPGGAPATTDTTGGAPV